MGDCVGSGGSKQSTESGRLPPIIDEILGLLAEPDTTITAPTWKDPWRDLGLDILVTTIDLDQWTKSILRVESLFN